MKLNHKERNLSIDLLRIISMLMIVELHLLSYTNLDKCIQPLSVEYFIKSIVHSVCIVSVNCYVLASGYLYDVGKFKIKKIFQIVFETLFYSILIYWGLVAFNCIEFSIKDLIYVFLPTLTRQYWFITTYIGLYLFTPVLKKIVNMFEKKYLLFILMLGFGLFVIYYNFFFFTENLNFGGATGIVWFIYLYLCGAYLKKYVKREKVSKSIRKFLIVLLTALFSKLFFIIIYLITKNEIFIKGSSVFSSVYNSIFGFLTSISFFTIFKNLNIKVNSRLLSKIILFLSTSTLSVYLIHDNPYFRNVLWNIIDFSNQNIVVFIGLIFITPLIIYLLSCMIDYFRQVVFSKIIFNENYCKKINNLENKIKEKFEYINKKI